MRLTEVFPYAIICLRGGVPFNSELELSAIRPDTVPMFARAYSATKNIPTIAQIWIAGSL